ncbi:galactokinase [Chloracidobacterium validum]|uniref:Galactokinase n=1 Tax=Chloracidobacterium validum TaxID=2821543 RepID=A0ABX8BB50_9BACT|nr:galactokinase [Chloracidobacterium validum]QUW04162.1 galactokinase [Chloracidobacterium validum]
MASPARTFHQCFNTPGRGFAAPGRVNLIGEHVDYNAGIVLPMAIDCRMQVWASPRPDRQLHVVAHDVGQAATLDLDRPERHTGTWRDYIAGTAFHLEAAGYQLTGANLLVTSDIPAGAGLSSSAALEVVVGFALLTLAGQTINRLALARAGQAAEHDFVGTHCGLMDQFVIAHGRAGHAVEFDCRSGHYEFVPLDPTACSVVVADSGIRHRLAGSAYNTRRQECETALKELQRSFPSLTTLRDVAETALPSALELLDEPLSRRVRHVVTEIGRVTAFAQALRAGDWTRAGQLLTASHRSLAEDYAVSCPELDALVAAAQHAPGCYGSRMTGGGFGGCTVNLVVPEALPDFQAAVSQAYTQAVGHPPRLWAVTPADGVGEIT